MWCVPMSNWRISRYQDPHPQQCSTKQQIKQCKKTQRRSKNTENLGNLFVVVGDLRGNSTPSQQAVSLPYQSHLQADRQPCLFVCLVLCCICLLHFCHPSTLYQQCHLSLLCKLTANPKPMSSVYPTPPKMQHNQSMADRLLVFGIEIFI